MVGEAFRAVAGPEVEFRAISKSLQTQLSRGFIASQRTLGHPVGPGVVQGFVHTIHDYFEAFTCDKSLSGIETLATSAEHSATGTPVGKEYVLFTRPLDRFEDVPPPSDTGVLNWKVVLDGEAREARSRPDLVARFRRGFREEAGNDQRRHNIAQYYFGLAARIYGVQDPIFEDLLIADLLHRRAQDLQAQDAVGAFRLSNRWHTAMGLMNGTVRKRVRHILEEKLSFIDKILMDDASSAWRRFLTRGVVKGDEKRVASIVCGYYNGKHIPYTAVDILI